jgi:hypothetical protein
MRPQITKKAKTIKTTLNSKRVEAQYLIKLNHKIMQALKHKILHYRMVLVGERWLDVH